MKVAVIYPFPPPIQGNIARLPNGLVTGGGETYPFSLANALSNAGHRVDFVTGKLPGIEIDQLSVNKNLRVYYLKLFGQHSIMKAWSPKLPTMLFTGKYDLIIANQLPILFTTTGGLISKLTKSKIVVLHLGFNPRFNFKSLLLSKLNVPLVDQLVIPSSTAGEFYKGIVSKEKTVTIQYGLDTTSFVESEIPCDLKDKYKGKLVIGYIGRLLASKGIDVLVRSVSRLRKEGFKVKLLIGGKGPFLDYLQDLVKKENLNSEVEFLGFIPEDKINVYYSLFDVFVLPSVYKDALGGYNPEAEAFGLVLGEAMACNTPVIGSSVGGIASWVTDRENGLLFEPGNDQELAEKIKLLVKDKNFAKEISQRAKKILEDKYSMKVVVKEFERLVQE
ncbi:MAG: glycosyltransferase family 4 protein [Patescibacteria group bacterium]|nr:glycosyltransferase family 4 protein [Patescibacteria group bacterium]